MFIKMDPPDCFSPSTLHSEKDGPSSHLRPVTYLMQMNRPTSVSVVDDGCGFLSQLIEQYLQGERIDIFVQGEQL